MRSGRAFAALTAAAALGACALKQPPDAVELRRQALPNLQVPQSWVSMGAGAGSVQAGWLGSFNDRQLSALIEEALKETVDGEFTTVADVAAATVFFAAFPTNALTGQSLIVSHGWFME